MKKEKNIFGCFLSYPSLFYGATEEEKNNAKKQGDLFYKYIWGDNGIDYSLKKIEYDCYGKDILTILFKFYINPGNYEIEALKKIEAYRKTEKSIGIPIIITDKNFFNLLEKDKYVFLTESIFEKLNLLTEVVNKKKLDTKMDLLKSDLNKELSNKIL